MSLNKYLQNWWGNDEKFTAPLLLSLYVSGVSCCRFPLLLLSNSQCLMSLRDKSRLHAYVKRCQRQLYPLSMYIYIVRECLRMPNWLSRSLLTHCTLNVEFQDIDFSPCHTLSLTFFSSLWTNFYFLTGAREIARIPARILCLWMKFTRKSTFDVRIEFRL